ncbi:MAG TPA: hypothetical protein VFG29_12660 [Syntrophales bacterium]|nr:hypothetical protein [Syntrophales bacterium]
MPANLSTVSYILRLYRFKKNNPRCLVGVVEEVGVNGKMAFTNYDELWNILNASRGVSSLGNNGMKKGSKKKVISSR